MAKEEMVPQETVEPDDPEGHDEDELADLATSLEAETAFAPGTQMDTDGRDLAYKIVHPAGERVAHRRSRRKKGPRKEGARSWLRLRALPLLGAVLGLVSFTLPWDTFPAFEWETYHRLGDYVFLYPYDYTYLLAVSAVIVLIGSLLLFVTSFGSVLQLSGLALFLYGMPGDVSHLSVGFVVCLSGAVLGCSSFVIRTPLAVPRRFLTFIQDPDDGGKVQVSVTALSCFVVGAISCALPWYIERWTWRYSYLVVRGDRTSSDTIFNFVFNLNEDILVVVGASLVIVGTFIALLTPLSGVVQGVGILTFFIGIQPRLASYSPDWGFDVSWSIGVGLFVGAIAAAIGVAALFVPFRVNLPFRTLSTVEGERPLEKRQRVSLPDIPSTVRYVLRRMLPVALAAAIVLSAAVTVTALAYALKWSSVTAIVGVYAPQEEEVEIAIFIDDQLALGDVAEANSQVIVKTHVTAGTHRISIDYCFLSLDPGGVDGTADWSTCCFARPFSSTVVMANVGAFGQTVLGIELEARPIENGTEIVVGDMEWSGWWPPSVSWTEITLALTDGTDYVSWSPSSADLDGGLLTEKTYDARVLGDTNVSCTILDFYGDGYVSLGDRIVFSSVDGTSFSADDMYALYVLHDENRSLIGECELSLG